ncbi:hypothetical protein CARUB_v10019533mg [Capsella rubella]|uniref:DUF1639 domain-containing protein n=1 Tax=Capsella rubella TaxID=81985 RepID=R0HLK8_9BRAS|nr:uncharacterized protein LOC17887377 [Capsella rubella]XP_023638158.1 uncharacterized protein LOC17887377 [Capsella rubella]XP_023638159.1 uncharacterized protein LOC17887377 [Capsella rubella]XP_023638160.1 uncharacterized protein LOC17887377 [Capsella rubella]EOA26110.1 hypothetical protein CARUB_v10019533mg [Capsella rubella]
MFRQSMAFPPPIHGSDAPPPQQPPPVVTVSETSRRQQQIAAASSSPVKSHPLHNFPLSDLRWAMNHANTHRLRKASSRSPLREPNPGKGNLVKEEVNEASGSSSFELRPEKRKGDSAADRSGAKSTTPDGRSKIFIRIRTKNNEETADVATTAVSTDIPPAVAAVHAADDSAGPAIDADGERISDGGGQEADDFGPKTWNLRPRKPPSTKKRSIGHAGGILKSCNGSLPENKPLGTVRTESIRSRSGVDAKMAATTTERKEKKPRLSISLSKLEIDEDIYALTGAKPSRRPKKRAKNVQKQLDVLFPGLWMGNVSSDAYKVSEHA